MVQETPTRRCSTVPTHGARAPPETCIAERPEWDTNTVVCDTRTEGEGYEPFTSAPAPTRK